MNNKTSHLLRTLCLSALATSLVLSSCSKSDDNPTPATPSTEVTQNAELLKLLQAPANGWEVALYPSNNQRHGGYTLFLKLDANGQVRSINELVEGEERSTSYKLTSQASTNTLELKELIQPSLIAERKASIAADLDDSFTIQSYSANEVRLKGTKNGSIAILRPASETAWVEQLNAIKAIASDNVVTHFDLLKGASQLGTGSLNLENRHLSVSLRNGATSSYAFRYTRDGIELFESTTIAEEVLSALESKRTATTAELKSKTGELTLKAIASPLSELLKRHVFTYTKENTTGRAQQSWTRITSLFTTLNRNSITRQPYPKLHEVKEVKVGTLDGKFGLFIKFNQRVEPRFNQYDILEHDLTLPLRMVVEQPNQVKFTYDITGIEEDSTLDRLTKSPYFLHILAAGFGRIGEVNYPRANPWYKESYEPFTFNLTADNPFRPTEITLTNVADETHTIKLQIPQN